MKNRLKWMIPIIVLLLVIAALVIIDRDVILSINGIESVVHTRSFHAGQILEENNISLHEYDEISHEFDSFIGWGETITINKAILIVLQINNQTPVEFPSTHKLPVDILAQAGIELNENDRIMWNGTEIGMNQPLEFRAAYFLQYFPANQMIADINQQQQNLDTNTHSILKSLYDKNILLHYSDTVSKNILDKPQQNDMFTVRSAFPVHIVFQNQQFTEFATSTITGEALAETGLSLQGLDYSSPQDNSELSYEQNINLIHVEEVITLNQTAIPFDTEYVANDELELDQRSIVEAGQYGVLVSRIRTRFENGEELFQIIETEWTAAEPVNQLIGYGTRIAINTIDTPGGPLEYWRATPIYATSYSPCKQGYDYCTTATASGIPLEKGVVGVPCNYLSDLMYMQVYIPGYGIGIIGDCGGGIEGKFLMDLGFSEEDYESWHYDTTAYFLTPVPDTIPWIFP